MFIGHKKELEKLGYLVYSDTVTTPKGDIVASVNPYGELDTKEDSIKTVLATKPAVKKDTAPKTEVKKLLKTSKKK